ncbi:cytochrome P450 [Aspergillus brunneoviolaceus CBS 621.78]|uniref:Cytochrome P450 n=1 Tax=Aspergillus brunneoviolaceus CBS 621.78 TaxID=1450534 RepID=A0ACD1GCJ2_9EURO|nr:cytochrome P450 [Aspergillus brunneoviolaceus CBS 621.78]RAH46897.1 cytochrome P450 [Aspergillus brunneoviolaceus CBS 621.78]
MAFIIEQLESYHLLQGAVVALLLVLVLRFSQESTESFPYKNIPLIGKSRWELSNSKAKQRFVTSAKELFEEGFSQGRKVFQLVAASDPTIVLHPSLVDEVKNHPHLSFDEANKKFFFGSKIPGFEVFEKIEPIQMDVINKRLTHSLGQLVTPLSKETSSVLREKLPKSDAWTPVSFAMDIPYIVARLSTLVFLGEKICRDEQWLNVSVNFTIDAFVGARDLRAWPSILQPLVHWFIPTVQGVRKHVKIGSAIVNKEIERRRLIREGRLPAENPPRSHEDTLDWFHELADGRPLNVAQAQMGLTMAAIHTTSNLLTNVMYDLTAYPEYIQILRDEIQTVITEDGGSLKKTSLTKMKKMDSVLKESQRMNAAGIAFLNRLATKEISLSDGMRIPKGASMLVSAHIFEDASIYTSPDVYDGLRFYKWRQSPGSEHRFQFVTTSAEHYAFGHGMHACPGRFFAANEIKILLVHLLMRYDWKFEDRTERPPNFMHGTESICDPTVRLLFRFREPEVDLSRLE